MGKYKVVIVEDQMMPRKLFEQFVQLSEQFETMEVFDDADMAEIYCLRNTPDLILMDVMTRGGCNGLTVAKRIKATKPEIKIIIVTSMPEISWIKTAKEAGIDSFWYKDVSEEPIISMMERTMAGERIYPENTPNIQFGNTFSNNLTEREEEILRKLAIGATNNEIADQLFISVPTVKKYIQGMLDKTGFKNRTELAVRARGMGLIILNEK